MGALRRRRIARTPPTVRIARVMLPLALTVGCGSRAREADCARVREILDPPPTAPRRTYGDGAATAPAEALPPFERLRRATWTSDEVRAAVQAAVAEAGPVLSYSPYRAAGDAPGAIDRLAGLCGLRRLVVDE